MASEIIPFEFGLNMTIKNNIIEHLSVPARMWIGEECVEHEEVIY